MHKIVKFLSLNICYVLYVLLWIKYWLMWFESLLVFILFKFKKRPNISGIRVVVDVQYKVFHTSFMRCVLVSCCMLIAKNIVKMHYKPIYNTLLAPSFMSWCFTKAYCAKYRLWSNNFCWRLNQLFLRNNTFKWSGTNCVKSLKHSIKSKLDIHGLNMSAHKL